MKYKKTIIILTLISTLNATSPKDSNITSVELEKLELQNKILEAKLKLKELTQKSQKYKEIIEAQNSAKIAEAKTDKITNEIDLKKAKWELKKDELESKLSIIKIEKELNNYVAKKPVYLDNPLTKDNRLIISDRRVALNGAITDEMADRIVRKINYFNNKDAKKPIFIVIDSSPGGSVMAGYQIMKAMDSSKAPIYVVLKSFAASMAAIIVTLADKSFAYSHATMLHHQPSMYQQGNNNLTEQKENYKNLERWWKFLATPIAKKMKISIDEFQLEMYKHSSKGNWSEFAIDAQKIGWVNTIVDKIEETSIVSSDVVKKEKDKEKNKDKDNKDFETINRVGNHSRQLPHLNPNDAYFIYNPNGYYKF